MLEDLPQPVIVAVRGYALGGGCEIALACDLRIATGDAKFGQPEINLGIMPGLGGSIRLPRLVGQAKAMQMILTPGCPGRPHVSAPSSGPKLFEVLVEVE